MSANIPTKTTINGINTLVKKLSLDKVKKGEENLRIKESAAIANSAMEDYTASTTRLDNLLDKMLRRSTKLKNGGKDNYPGIMKNIHRTVAFMGGIAVLGLSLTGVAALLGGGSIAMWPTAFTAVVAGVSCAVGTAASVVSGTILKKNYLARANAPKKSKKKLSALERFLPKLLDKRITSINECITSKKDFLDTLNQNKTKRISEIPGFNSIGFVNKFLLKLAENRTIRKAAKLNRSFNEYAVSTVQSIENKYSDTLKIVQKNMLSISKAIEDNKITNSVAKAVNDTDKNLKLLSSLNASLTSLLAAISKLTFNDIQKNVIHNATGVVKNKNVLTIHEEQLNEYKEKVPAYQKPKRSKQHSDDVEQIVDYATLALNSGPAAGFAFAHKDDEEEIKEEVNNEQAEEKKEEKEVIDTTKDNNEKKSGRR